MARQSQQFLRVLAVASITFTMVAAVFSFVVDPYAIFGMPRIDGFNARKPAVNTQPHLMKAYDVLRAAPTTLILGSSRVALGIDARHAAWPSHDRPVYNLAFAGGSPYIAYRYLQHVTQRKRPSLVLLGLDFEYFLPAPDTEIPGRQEFESRLAVTYWGAHNEEQRRQHVLDVLKGTLSLESFLDSGSTWAANVRSRSEDLVAGNWELNGKSSLPAWSSNAYENLVRADLVYIRYGLNTRRNPAVIGDVQAIFELCRSRGTNIILFINPGHADFHEIVALLGHWDAFEEWKRELVKLAERYSAPNGSVPIWDFADYGTYSTENVTPEASDLRWFIDSGHYSRALGDLMIKRIVGLGAADLGTSLNSGNVESHFAMIREQQRMYREQHPEAVRRVHFLYNSVMAASIHAKRVRAAQWTRWAKPEDEIFVGNDSSCRRCLRD